jgi:hypothetical protein
MANTFTLIGSTTLGTASSSITFSSIPNTYDDLIIYCSLRNAGPGDTDLYVRLNGDSANNYAFVSLRGSGTPSVSTNNSNTTNAWQQARAIGTPDASHAFSCTQIYISGYKSTSFTKAGYINTFMGRYGSEGNSIVGFSGQQWNSTSAVTSVAIFSPTQNLTASSSAYLYGIKRT